MFILKIISQYRRDFTAIYKCEHCEHEEEYDGYDDSYFHSTVIPDMECPICHKKADKEKYRPLPTKYKKGQIV
jgi:rubrerythrin